MRMMMRMVLASISQPLNCRSGDEDETFIKCSLRMKMRMMRMKIRMMRIVLASISQPLNCRSAGVPSGMRPSVCKMDTMMEKVAMMMKVIRTSLEVGTLRPLIELIMLIMQ